MTYRTIRIKHAGPPEVMELAELSSGRAPSDDEVLVDLRAVGVNRSDAAFRSGNYLIRPDPPCGLGIEGSGVVAAVGARVDRFAIGQRVCILPGFPQGGQYATYLSQGLFPASSLIETPDELDDVSAAALWIATLTAWGALIELGGLARGDHVLISAAPSSVGVAAIQIATSVGAIPIATTRNAAKADVLKSMGADHVLVGENHEIAAMVGEITGPAGLRIAFDPIAGRFAESLVPCMGDEGIIFVYGGLSDEPTQFDRRRCIARGISLTGYMVRQIISCPDRLARGAAFVREQLQKGSIRPLIDRVFPLDAAVEAHRYMESNAQVGKIVLTI